jgi:hypothetical protein
MGDAYHYCALLTDESVQRDVEVALLSIDLYFAPESSGAAAGAGRAGGGRRTWRKTDFDY